ncbi:hypothetical protein IEO21_03674 [Rhodonia placenta]|uniref:Uncharacterized protein n=1 Tax=Rhodonia placenta TaxID=104341 RepID=A0A8H7P5U7_9APHY|nr:hypothetical protein IEO21_03674 [Postia placenta]
MQISLPRIAVVQGCDPESDACHCAGNRPYNGRNKAITLFGMRRIGWPSMIRHRAMTTAAIQVRPSDAIIAILSMDSPPKPI